MILLISSVSQLRQYVNFSGDIDFDNLRPSIRSAQQLVMTYVGEALLTELSGLALSADQTALLPYVLAPIANLALLKHVRSSNVRITDVGILRTKTSDSNDAFEWQVDRVETHLKSEAFDGIEQLLGYLASNLTTFPAYTNSDEYNREKSRLITSASLFSQFYQIYSSRLVLETLSSCLLTAEDKIIPMLGDGLTAILGATPSELQKAQLKAARRAVVYLTIARALRERLVSISDAGVQISGISQFGTINYKDPASDKQLERSIAYFDGQAATFLSELVTALTPVSNAPAPTGSRVTGSSIVAF